MTYIGSAIPIKPNLLKPVNIAQAQPNKANPAVEENQDGKKKKEKEESGKSGSAEQLSAYSFPVNYSQYNSQVMENILSFLEQRWKILEDISNSLRPEKDEKKAEENIAEKKFWDKKELNKVQEKTRDAIKLVKRALNDMQTLIAIIQSPTTNPKARAAMVTAELARISGILQTATSEVKEAKGALTEINPLDDSAKAQKDNLDKSLTQLGTILKDTIDDCDKLKNGVERS